MTYRRDGEGNEDGRKEAAEREREASAEPRRAEQEQDERRESREHEGRRRDEPKSRPDGARRPVPASPATRRLARELGVALGEVEPSGPHGRVTADDVRGHAEPGGKRKGAPDKAAEPKEEQRPAPEARLIASYDTALPDFRQWGEVERRPLRSIRRATALRMARAWSQIPHVMHEELADITALEKFRKRHADSVEKSGGKLTLTVLVMKALVAALKAHPRFNASLDVEREELVLKRYHHIGVAIDTPDGLLVPVIRDVDRKSMKELASELVALGDRARSGRLQRAEMQGGSFTITNPGPIGGRSFTPIINYPEAAILGVGRARIEPVIDGTEDDYRVAARRMLPLCLAFDHRINDGADAARFMRTLAGIMREEETFLLNL